MVRDWARSRIANAFLQSDSAKCLNNSSRVLFECELSEQTTTWAPVGNNRNQCLAVKFEVPKERGVGTGSRMPMAAYRLSVMVWNEPACHLEVAVGARRCLVHGCFLFLGVGLQ